MGVLASCCCCCCCWSTLARLFLTICGVRLSEADAEEDALAVAVGGATPAAAAEMEPELEPEPPLAVAVALSCFSTASVMDDSCGAKKERRAARGSLLRLSLLMIARLSHWLRWHSMSDDGDTDTN